MFLGNNDLVTFDKITLTMRYKHTNCHEDCNQYIRLGRVKSVTRINLKRDLVRAVIRESKLELFGQCYILRIITLSILCYLNFSF